MSTDTWPEHEAEMTNNRKLNSVLWFQVAKQARAQAFNKCWRIGKFPRVAKPDRSAIKIAIHVAEEDEYPQMAAFREKLTCNFPFMTGYGIVVPYATFNSGGDALINHQYVPLNTNADNRKFKAEVAFDVVSILAPKGAVGIERNAGSLILHCAEHNPALGR
ncbi:hypothetical protein B0H11DRAFT_1938898 [Mycena galericulata]|nr:hypothetical protein B0H11DRAFT_1938898 [Mycena galericulata]